MLRHAGFTLIELLIVMSVVALLMGLMVAAFGSTSRNNQVKATKAAVDTVAAAISGHQDIAIADASGRLRPLWDFDQDGILDGDPSRSFVGSAAADAAAVGYLGPVRTLGLSRSDILVDDRTDRLVDAWRQPLRIRFHDQDYGANGFSVFSLGPDGQADTEDDVHSHGAD